MVIEDLKRLAYQALTPTAVYDIVATDPLFKANCAMFDRRASPDAKLYVGEIYFPPAIVVDILARDTADHFVTHIAKRIGDDLIDFAFNGTRRSRDTAYALQDGWIELLLRAGGLRVSMPYMKFDNLTEMATRRLGRIIVGAGGPSDLPLNVVRDGRLHSREGKVVAWATDPGDALMNVSDFALTGVEQEGEQIVVKVEIKMHVSLRSAEPRGLFIHEVIW